MNWENFPEQIQTGVQKAAETTQAVIDKANAIQNDPNKLQIWGRRIALALAVNIAVSGFVSMEMIDNAPETPAHLVACDPNTCPPITESPILPGDKRPRIKIPKTDTTKTPTTTTTLTPSPQPTTAVAPAPAPVVKATSITETRLPLTYQQYADNAQHYVDMLPDLDRLAQMFPSKAEWFRTQKDCIDKLAPQVHVTVDDYAQLELNKDHQTVFKEHPFYNVPISPKMFIVHTTGLDPNKSVDEVAEGMMRATRKNSDGQEVSDRRSVNFMVTPDGTGYQTMRDTNRMAAHALGANEFSVGVENFAVDSCDLTPEEVKTTVILAVYTNRKNNIPINATTILGHADIDNLLNNPTYNPDTGTATSLRKTDGLRNLIRVTVAEAMQLDSQLPKA